ncbi:MAG: ABC transporter C-terminal domain-containing protein, partial [Oscillospiraceae bacterium]|nr:ABC transporter C-terminal domain-containing protein [Oscillospiraceae bacterium]
TAKMPRESTQKKSYTTPLKEKARRERALKKAEELVEELENKMNAIQSQLEDPEVQSDYVRLTELQDNLTTTQNELDKAMMEWERFAEESQTL